MGGHPLCRDYHATARSHYRVTQPHQARRADSQSDVSRTVSIKYRLARVAAT
jgi:hypothetical protein